MSTSSDLLAILSFSPFSLSRPLRDDEALPVRTHRVVSQDAQPVEEKKKKSDRKKSSKKGSSKKSKKDVKCSFCVRT